MSTVSLCYSWECEDRKIIPGVKFSNTEDIDDGEVSDEEAEPLLVLVEV